jgi:hypothetical protein
MVIQEGFLGLALAAFVLVAGAAHAENPKSIVGWWGFPGGECTPASGAVSIEPMALWGDDVRCDFSSVKRNGNKVTWQGKCFFGQGNETGAPADETVIATETNGKLRLDFGSLKDNDWPSLKRCTPSQ